MDLFAWTDVYIKDFYSPVHIAQIAVMVAALVGAGFLFYKRKNLENKMYIFLAISSNAITLTAFIYSLITKKYNLEWYVPLHICNLFIIISVLSCIFKKKVRKFLNEYMVYCGLGGCMIGIIIPASTLYYFEAYNFISMIIWLYHIIIGVMAIYLITSGVFKVKFYNSWKAFVILIPLAVCAMIVNNLLNTNFIGLNRFKPIFGLEIIANLTNEFYAITLISIFLGIGLILSVISVIIKFAPKKKRCKLNAIKYL